MNILVSPPSYRLKYKQKYFPMITTIHVCVCVCVYGFLKILCFCLSANVIFMSEKQNCACFLQLEKRFKSTLIF